MSNPLRLDLVTASAIRYTCGCTVVIPFEDAACALGMACPSTKGNRQPDWAHGSAYYRVAKRGYSCRLVLHTMKEAPEESRLSVEFRFEPSSDRPTDGDQRVSLSAIADGLKALSSRDAHGLRAVANMFWVDPAPAIASLSLPSEWPNGVRIAGVELVAPGERATAIVQNRQMDSAPGSVATVSFDGGSGIAPRQISASFHAISRLGDAFRSGDWSTVAKEVARYGQR